MSAIEDADEALQGYLGPVFRRSDHMPQLPPIALCASCGAEIRWIETAKGRRAPINAQPEIRLVLRFNTDRMAWVGTPTQTFTSHFASCPQAGQWRRTVSTETPGVVA